MIDKNVIHIVDDTRIKKCYSNRCNIFPTKYWHIAWELVIPCGRTVHWYLCKSSCWLKLGTESVNLFLSLGCIEVLSKQSCKSKTIKGHSLGKHAGVGNPGCKALIVTIDAFPFLKSIRSPHFPDFFLIKNSGEFQGEKEGCLCLCS
jgi:hypothetical protein